MEIRGQTEHSPDLPHFFPQVYFLDVTHNLY